MDYIQSQVLMENIDEHLEDYLLEEGVGEYTREHIAKLREKIRKSVEEFACHECGY